MPLSPESSKKIWFVALIVMVVAGLLFMVFAFFINRGTLVIKASAPYIVSIFNTKTEACPQDTCEIVLAPGDYNLTLKKEGYKDETLKVSVPIGGRHEEEVTFEFIPFITLASEDNSKLFETVKVTDATLPENVFYGGAYVAYLERDQESHHQTLFLRAIQDGKVGAKTIVTSFIRDPKNYEIILGVEDHNSVALIDETSTGDTLYLIDLKEKTRNSLFTYPQIEDVRWMPADTAGNISGNLLFEARAEGDATNSIFFYDAQKKESKKLDLKTDLKNVVPVSADLLIAATDQQIKTGEDLISLEGQLIVLGEREATPQTTDISGQIPGLSTISYEVTSRPVLTFVDYSLVSGQSRLLRVAPDLAYPSQAMIGDLQKSVLFLVGDNVYELHFRD